jgi:hypothetical protein
MPRELDWDAVANGTRRAFATDRATPSGACGAPDKVSDLVLR